MTVSITNDETFEALRQFILAVLPALGNDNVRQGQQNRVPMPPGPDFVIMTPTDRGALATTVRDYTPPTDPAPAVGSRETTRSTRVGVQLDFYGEGATDNAQIFNQLFRDMYGCDFLRPYHVQPLWCDDGRQMPLVDDESQYETRWMVHALMQINPTVSTSQEFADMLDVTLVEADQNGN